jgi:hypothetical protein
MSDARTPLRGPGVAVLREVRCYLMLRTTNAAWPRM